MNKATHAARAAAVVALIGLFIVVTAAPSQAEDRRVRIINETSVTLVEFYASNVGTNDWEEDILGYDVLSSGDNVIINIDDGTGYCLYDFKGVFADGDVIVDERIDVCEVSSHRYYE
tara:strand:- start:577 stop:927 length:351 start_codon:yes stop_codon:yes gene_type:complete